MTNTARCSGIQNCIRNLKFVSTTNGGTEQAQLAGTTPTGDCVVIATSIAADLSYAEAQRRLALLANSLEKYRQALAEAADQNPDIDIPGDIADRDPIHGTHLVTCSLFLLIHHFDRRDRSHCVCDRSTPHVVAGTTDDGSPHAVAVVNGQAYGTYDVTIHDFEAIDVWERELEPIPEVEQWLESKFTNQRTVNAHVKQRLLPDRPNPQPEIQA